jgi:hypothetical protein
LYEFPSTSAYVARIDHGDEREPKLEPHISTSSLPDVLITVRPGNAVTVGAAYTVCDCAVSADHVLHRVATERRHECAPPTPGAETHATEVCGVVTLHCIATYGLPSNEPDVTLPYSADIKH